MAMLPRGTLPIPVVLNAIRRITGFGEKIIQAGKEKEAEKKGLPIPRNIENITSA